MGLAGAHAQHAGNLKQENNPALSYSTCDESGCQSQQRSVTIDSNWRWTHKRGQTQNCYTGNTWDSSACPDPETCWENCEIEGADEEYTSTYGVKASSDTLQLDFVTQGPYSKNVGSRTYLLDSSKEKYEMFKLKNREFTFDVDVSQLPCGLNGALYFVAMDADGGKSRHSKNQAGAKYGTGYCDAQCLHDLKWINGVANVKDWIPQKTDKNAGLGKYGTCCTELDLWEANSISTAFTMHSCSVSEQTRCEGIDCGDNAGAVTPEAHRFEGVCDKNGCDFATTRLNQTKFYGPGSNYQVDSTKKITVVTQFLTDDGTDTGKVSEVKQFYVQDGKTIHSPKVTLQGKEFETISADFCQAWVDTTKDGTNFLQKGGFDAVDEALEKGVVLVMSLWDDHFANMLWLDSIYPTDSSDPTNYRGSCSKDSGVPKDIETKDAKSHVIFSNIKAGKIGSTTGSSPSPSPSGSGCCSWDGKYCGKTTDYCAANAAQCEDCKGSWCSDCAAPFTTAAPATTPAGGDCPGGSLSACLADCPAAIYKECAASCAARCSSLLV